MQRLEFEAIGTRWQIDFYSEITPLQLNELNSRIQTRITDFDQTYSRFKSHSLVTQMSREKGTYQLPEDADRLFEIYKKLYILTDGIFTPLIGQVLDDAGYDATYSLKTKQLKKPPKWEDVIEYQTGGQLIMRQPAILDFGAGGKGYLIDLVSEVIQSKKINAFCIDAGGDILHVDRSIGVESTPIKIGLENPANTQQVIGVAEIANQSICGSAGNRRAWGDFHHMIDPHTLTSPKDILATWVIASDGLSADALATALFFVPSSKLLNEFRFEYVILRSDFSIEKSSDFPGEFFYNG